MYIYIYIHICISLYTVSQPPTIKINISLELLMGASSLLSNPWVEFGVHEGGGFCREGPGCSKNQPNVGKYTIHGSYGIL